MGESKEAVAMELAERIYKREFPGSNLEVGPDNAREYWLRLYDQCLNAVMKSAAIDNIVLLASRKKPE